MDAFLKFLKTLVTRYGELPAAQKAVALGLVAAIVASFAAMARVCELAP